jgi:putative flippase GtrA
MSCEPRRLGKILCYSLVGVVNTATDFAVFSILYYVAGWGPLWANSLAFGIAVSQSYLLNARWTFQQRTTDLSLKAYANFVMINLGCLSISSGTIYMLQSITSPLMAKLLAAGIVLVWGFLMSNRFVFATRQHSVLRRDGKLSNRSVFAAVSSGANCQDPVEF